MGKPERRQQILGVARDVFARRGYHAAKIDDIVAAAGVARGTFYLYFEDKRAIFEEIVDRTIARLGMAIVRVDPHDESRGVDDQVRENVRRIVRILLEDRSTTKILLSDALGVDPAFDRKLLSFFDEMSSMLERSLEDGQKLGVVGEGDVRLLSWLTMGALKEVMFQIVQRGAEYEEDKLVEGILALFAKGYLRV
ncbi:MAG TPA: TetR/AcrR family transcriptional regulator [Polyangiaceae bacterium]|nr:TetR/AcrR family transcriptional regulator [Polyangiaceae bacterium]